MIFKTRIFFAISASFALLSVQSLMASEPVDIDLVMIGNPGNQADMNGKGAVSTSFQLGKYDVTADQYCQFLNAVAGDDLHGLYDPRMHTDSYVKLIERTVNDDGSYSYTVNPDRKNFPIVYISCASAQRFCNWLQNGQPTGEEDVTTTEDGTYTFTGTTNDTVVLANPNAAWRLPTDDEWYKAAYYQGGGADRAYWKYTTQSDTTPSREVTQAHSANYGTRLESNHLTTAGAYTKSPGVYGTFDMGGDVAQWTSSMTSSGSLMIRGGDWMAPPWFVWDPAYKLRSDFCAEAFPEEKNSAIGFRVVGPMPDVLAATNEGSDVTQSEDSINYASLEQANNGSNATNDHWTTVEDIAGFYSVIALVAVAASGQYHGYCRTTPCTRSFGNDDRMGSPCINQRDRATMTSVASEPVNKDYYTQRRRALSSAGSGQRYESFSDHHLVQYTPLTSVGQASPPSSPQQRTNLANMFHAERDEN